MYDRIAFLTAFKLSLVKRQGWANTKLEISKKNCETNLLGFQLYLTTHISEIGGRSPDQQFELNTTMSAVIALWIWYNSNYELEDDMLSNNLT